MKIKFLFLFVLVLIFFPICGCKPDPVALITAVKADNTADAMKLIGKGADANVRTTPNGWSALHYAARNGNVEEVRGLLNAGADANYAATMDGKAGSPVKPLALAQIMLEVIGQVQNSQIEANLRESGVNDPALLKSATDPKAAERYQKVVDLLTKATK
ncbi:MAG TPA: ankyrin repeat domain-containing protein [Terracidiphilus sp.]|jgi:ankyrin repeat protein